MKTKIYVISSLLYLMIISCTGKINQNTVTDIDGNVCRTVVIGEQEWMVENLKTTRYNDGTPIPNVEDVTEWRNMDAPAYVWYDNNISNKDIYGALYNWHVVATGRLCPEGWHVAKDEDWKELEAFLGMTFEEIEGTAMRGTNEGHTLKEIEKWVSLSEETIIEHGLGIVPSGRRDSRGCFYDMGKGSTIWTSSETSESCAYYRHFASTNAGIGRNPEGDKKFGFAVRCIKDK